MKGYWFVVDFYGDDVWNDLDFWYTYPYGSDERLVDYEYQQVHFKMQPIQEE